MYVKYVDHMGDDLRAVNCARVSFNQSSDQFSARDERLINYLADHEHYSPFEHCLLTVEIKAPLYIRSQIMRHRTFAYSEVSRRYTAEEIEFYWPPNWRTQSKDNKQGSAETIAGVDAIADLAVSRVYEAAHDAYDLLLSRGIAREMARGVLPQNLYTKFIMTGNLRNWVHFCKLRLDSHAQQEAQVIAAGIKKILDEKFPVSTAALFK